MRATPRYGTTDADHGAAVGNDAVEAIVDEGAPATGPAYTEPSGVRLLGPLSDVPERVVRAVTLAWWLRRMRQPIFVTTSGSRVRRPSDAFPDVVPLVPVRGVVQRLAQSPATVVVLTATVTTTGLQLIAPGLDIVARLGVGTDVIDGQWWRLLTYLLPQKLGIPHLLLNATGIAFYGPFLERRIGHAGMLLTYAVSGVFGGAWLVGAGQRDPNAGASLALFGVLAALASVDHILSRADVLPDAASRRSLVIVVAVTALLWPIEAAALLYEDRPLTLALSFWGIVRHSPGLVAGLVLGLALGVWRVRRSPAWAGAAAACVLAASAAFVELRTGLWPLWPS